METFASLDDTGNTPSNKDPIWKVGFGDEKKLLDWLTQEHDFLKKQYDRRYRDIVDNYSLYKGDHYIGALARRSTRDYERPDQKLKQKTAVNKLYNITETLVSKVVRQKPGINFLPRQDDSYDRIAARITKRCYQQIADTAGLDSKRRAAVRMSKIAGEAYLKVDWDKDAGPELTSLKRFREIEQKFGSKTEIEIDATSEYGAKVNRKINLEKETVHVGDVSLKLVSPLNLVFEQRNDMSLVNYCFEDEEEERQALIKKYGKKAEAKTYEVPRGRTTRKTDPRYAHVVCFYLKKSKEVPNGRYIKFLPGQAILENAELPFEHGDLPYERLADIELPDELHAQSFFSNVKSLQVHYNNLTNMILRSVYLTAYAKWFVPENSVSLQSLTNDHTIVQFKGPIPPQLSQPNPVSGDVFRFRDKIREEMLEGSGQHQISTGNPPPGIKAGIALQELEEQEHNRMSSYMSGYNDWNRRIAKKIISVAAQYYQVDDERYIRTVGESTPREKLDPKYLSRGYDVEIQSASSLPSSLAAKRQFLIDMREAAPTEFSERQFIEMMELGNKDRYYEEATAAVRAAEESFEDLIEGKSVPEPVEWDRHLDYWHVYSAKIQEYSFKKMPTEIQDRVLDHFIAREMMMWDKAQKNPAFAQMLAVIPEFPMLFEPEPAPPPMPDPAADPEMIDQAMQDPMAAQTPPIGSGPVDEQMMPLDENPPIQTEVQ